MKEVVLSSYLARFESFEVNLRSEELRKDGDKIKLPGQSFQILAMLLERPGEVVMRREIQNRLWPNDTVVEFENSINAAIKRLRAALGDSADQPRYIETLARRGYRWIVPVEWTESPTVPAGVLSSAHTAEAAGTVFGKRRGPPFIFSAALVVAAAIAFSSYFFTHRTPKLIPKDPIILADFTNTTGDSVFDGTLRQGLLAQLQQSPFLNMLSDEQIAGTLRLMSQPAGTRFTHELARQVCQRTAGAAVLEGSIAQVGSQYQLILSASDCSTGALLGSGQSVASDKNRVLGALDSAASMIRAKLGESLASIQKFNTPLEEVTTPSLEALQAYTLGWQAYVNGDEPAAFGSFERAISLDPNFAMAYAALGTAYGGAGETGLAAANNQKAYDLRERVSEREKFYISSHYEMNATGDLEKASQVFKIWAQSYPKDVVPVEDLGWDYTAIGQYDESLAEARQAVDLAPNLELPYELLAYSYLELDRFDEAATVLRQGKERGIDSPALHNLAYGIAFVRGDTAEMLGESAWAAGKPGIEDVMIDFQSDAAAYLGHLEEANDLTARAAVSARHAGAKERAAGYLAVAALREALVNEARQARIEAASAVQASSDQEAQVPAALALALSGDLARAQKLADALSERFPQHTVVQFNYLPTIRAAIALRQKSPAKAIADLQVAAPYELGTPGVTFGLCPVYVRGEAYLAAHRTREAGVEFQKILDHRGIALNGPGTIAALAHLQIGRAYAMQGNTAEAVAAYRDFFSLWKDADPDIPILIAAKSEYAKLR